jgi:drug/metabolite transporter (DMT)-like permease
MAVLEARRIAEQFPKETSPREHRIFGGIIDMRGTPMWGRAFYRLTGGRPGDHRDWPVIEAWGSHIAGALMSTAPAGRESAGKNAVGERQMAAARETSATPAPDASGARRALGVACGLMSATAVAGVVGLVGDGIDLGPTITARLPFHSQVLGGVALAGIVAVPMGAAAVAGWRRSTRTGDFAVLAGTALGGWIVGQVAIIRTFSWMQPVCFAYGVAVAGAGQALRRRPARRQARR